ncbi:hypothetical protein SELMODRAFT_413193 [Selaginella moellendorffii]|uniref:Bifunctional inhibitor/plant lipid transfer protein/seed storage helical domain-containing protein n=1 Tax=Selaginella moellendorffii TaxID=88036 RepID=D8RNN0_SELML|nr:non-specific lipid-transfer protein Cw18 [Selaginella moellendorffii]EFJ25894.1 hypothetical protein SELMODRAFT_413193 [Selaginella moellendorffii]|eukprot:XP_002972673.1 non-specific lipid-transfer protein Cw18 [Selaginella moellendorffii]
MAVKIAMLVLVSYMLVSMAAAATCSNNYSALLPCAAATRSATATPSAACCKVVEGFKSNPACLCSTIAAARAAGYSINEHNAESIPTRCKLHGYTPCSKKN